MFRRAAGAERWAQAKCHALWWSTERAHWLGTWHVGLRQDAAESRAPGASADFGTSGPASTTVGTAAAFQRHPVGVPFLVPLPLSVAAQRCPPDPTSRPVRAADSARRKSKLTYSALIPIIRAQFLKLVSRLKKLSIWMGVAGAGLAASGAAAAFANFLYWHQLQPADFFLQRLAAKVRPGVFGPSGDWLGVIPPASDAIFQLDRVGVQMTELPPDFCRVLLRLEDSHSGQWLRGHVAGVDWPAVPVRFISGLLPGRKPGGASTLWMQTASMAGEFKTQYSTLPRKAREYAGAAELHAALNGDVNRIALAYASIAPYARGMGGDVIGLVAASDIIFGIAPDRLSLAQMAILASAPNRPLWLNEDSARARDAFAAVKRRAAHSLAAEFDPAVSGPAIADIKAMGELPPVRTLIGSLAEAVTGTVEGRTRAFVLPVLPAIRSDLNAIQNEGINHATASL